MLLRRPSPLVLSFSSRGSSWTSRSQDANHESRNRHVLAFWKKPFQSLRIWVHPYAAIPIFAVAQRAQMDLQRSQTHTHLEDQLYPMVECELQASAVGRVRHEPQAARGIDSTSRRFVRPLPPKRARRGGSQCPHPAPLLTTHLTHLRHIHMG